MPDNLPYCACLSAILLAIMRAAKIASRIFGHLGAIPITKMAGAKRRRYSASR
jgi:hypothetical protein